MSDRNEVLQKMSDVYGGLIEAKSYLDESRLLYKDAIMQHNNFDLEISRLIDQLKYGYPENEIDVIGKLNQVYRQVYRQDREIEAILPNLCKNYQDSCARFNKLEKQLAEIIEELKNFAEEE